MEKRFQNSDMEDLSEPINDEEQIQIQGTLEQQIQYALKRDLEGSFYLGHSMLGSEERLLYHVRKALKERTDD